MRSMWFWSMRRPVSSGTVANGHVSLLQRKKLFVALQTGHLSPGCRGITMHLQVTRGQHAEYIHLQLHSLQT